MDHKDYIASRNLALQVLLRWEVCELPVRTSILCREIVIALAYGTHDYGGDGYCTIVDGSMYIVIRKGLPITRTRFTVAHEMGHLLLGHVGDCHIINRKSSAKDNPREQAADAFASHLLAPTCVLWGCGLHTAESIANSCNISLQSAKIKANHMALLLQKNKLLTSQLERQVYAQFLPFICSHHRGAPSCPENPL